MLVKTKTKKESNYNAKIITFYSIIHNIINEEHDYFT